MASFKKLLILSFLSVAVTASAGIYMSPQAHAAYEGGNIIDNRTFLNSATMNADGIQSFLASKGSGLASRYFYFDCNATADSAQYYRNAGAPCQQNVLASQIIYYATQIYGVNPQAILATLQKEQSLVTTANPTDWQINQAMGYGCPTTTGCGSSNFLYQIDNGVWVQRLNFERARGNNTWWFTTNSWVCGTQKAFYRPNLYPGQNVDFIDELGVYYRTHFIANAATSSYYCYTPHAYNNPQGLYGLPQYGTTGKYYSGSYNFVTFFERWFGTTRTGDPTLFKGTDSPLVYVSIGGYKVDMPSMSLLQDYAYDPRSIATLPQSYVNSIPYAPGSTGLSSSIGYAVKSPSDTDADGGAAYLISRGQRIVIQSMQQFYAYGLKESDIKYLPLDYIMSLSAAAPLSNYAQMPDGAINYVAAGSKRLILDYQSFIGLNPSGTYSSLSEAALGSVSVGNPISSSPVAVKSQSSPAVYILTNDTYYLVPSMAEYACWGIDTRAVGLNQIPASRMPAVITSAADLSCMPTVGATIYSLSQNSYQTVPSSLGITPSQPLDQSLLPIIKNRNDNGQMKQFIKSNDAPIWMIEQGKKRLIPSYQNYARLGSPSFSSAADGFISSIPQGSDILGDGQIIKDPTSPAVYVAEKNSLYTIPSLGAFNSARFNWSDLETYPLSDLSTYQVAAAPIGDTVVGSDGSYILGDKTCYKVLTELISSYNLPLTNYSLKALPGINPSLCMTASKYVKSPDSGTVYGLSNGTLRPIGSWSALVADAKTTTPPITILSPSRISSYPVGNPF